MAAFRVDVELEREPLTTAEDKDRAIARLRSVFAELTASALREELLHRVARAMHAPPATVAQWLHTEAASPTPPEPKPAAGSVPRGDLAPDVAAARDLARAAQARPAVEATRLSPPRAAATPAFNALTANSRAPGDRWSR